KFGLAPVVTKHKLQLLDLFSDSALTELLESHPRDHLQAFTMGTDCENRHEWQSVDTAGASGRDLFGAIAAGHLWFNIFRVQRFHSRFRDLLDQLFGEISEARPGFRCFNQTATLIISSPNALVYYHADAQPNFLWHVRGARRVWVYPAGECDIICQEFMGDIFVSNLADDVSYHTDFL